MVSPPPSGMKRYKAFVSYDGTDFHGFAPNPGVETVGGLLRSSIERILGVETKLTCAGRTDAGVHAEGQVISFDAEPLNEQKLEKALNKLCSPHVAIRSLKEVDPLFDARFSAKCRKYRYQILNQTQSDPFMQRYVWHIRDQLDIKPMKKAALSLIGEHDFSSFCRKRAITINGIEAEASLIRNVYSIDISRTDRNLIEIWIAASSFCHQMVRSVTGTLVEIGLGRIASDEMSLILQERNRNSAGRVAPPNGLTLMEVEY